MSQAERKAKRENNMRFLTPRELADLKRLQEIVQVYKFLSSEIGANTLLIPNHKFSKYFAVNAIHFWLVKLLGINRISAGQRIAAEFGAISELVSNVSRRAAATLFISKGYKPDDIINLDFLTGEIKVEEKNGL